MTKRRAPNHVTPPNLPEFPPFASRAPTRAERREMMVDATLSMREGELPEDFTTALTWALFRHAYDARKHNPDILDKVIAKASAMMREHIAD